MTVITNCYFLGFNVEQSSSPEIIPIVTTSTPNRAWQNPFTRGGRPNAEQTLGSALTVGVVDTVTA